jgi:hypothetical protein
VGVSSTVSWRNAAITSGSDACSETISATALGQIQYGSLPECVCRSIHEQSWSRCLHWQQYLLIDTKKFKKLMIWRLFGNMSIFHSWKSFCSRFGSRVFSHLINMTDYMCSQSAHPCPSDLKLPPIRQFDIRQNH